MIRTISCLTLLILAVLLTTGCFRRHLQENRPSGKAPRKAPPPSPQYSPEAPKLRGNPSPVVSPDTPAPQPMPVAESPLVSPVPPQSPAATKTAHQELNELLDTATKAWQALDTFEAQLTRRELNRNRKMRDEVLVFQLRREPLAVYTRNVGEANTGRELIYFPSKHGDKIYVKLGKGDQFPGAGFIAPPISPDDRRVTAESRYSIREVGFDRIINQLRAQLAKVQAGQLPTDALVYEGAVKRNEYPYPLVGVTQKILVGDEPLFPKGGTRRVYFDMNKDSPAFGLPVLSLAIDESGKEVEYYLFEKVRQPAGLTDADFDPDRRKSQ